MHNLQFTGSDTRMMWYIPQPVRFVVFLSRYASSVSIVDQAVDFIFLQGKNRVITFELTFRRAIERQANAGVLSRQGQ